MSATAKAVEEGVRAPLPEVKGGVVAYLQVDGAIKASEFYQKAFGAVEVARHPPDEKGRTMHVHLYLNGSSIMLGDAYPDYGHPLEKPAAFNLMLPVKGIDQWWNRAIAAGMTEIMPVQVMFWGDRYGQLRDPFGVMWSLNEPVG
jgi:PhnB protein